jgi:hypothetical protein
VHSGLSEIEMRGSLKFASRVRMPCAFFTHVIPTVNLAGDNPLDVRFVPHTS